MNTIKIGRESSGKKAYKSWRKSVEKDGITKSVSVNECENGFIIEICEYGNMDGGWKDDTKKFISTKNPLDELDLVKGKDDKEEWKEALEALGI